MSSRYHTRSWRPEGGRRRKSSHRLKIVGLTFVLLLLGAFGVWISLPGSPTPVQFISIVETGYFETGDGRQPFSPNSGGQRDAEQLQAVFDVLHQASDERVSAPVATGLTDLQDRLSSVPKNAALVVYCSAHAVAGIEKDALKLDLLAGSGDRRVSFSDLLNDLQQTSPTGIVLLLDVSQTRPGLMNGILANDNVALVQHMLEHAAADENGGSHRNVTVICSAGPGERNWPWPAVAAANETDGTAGGNSSSAHAPFAGTVFGHAIADAFRRNETETIDALEASIRNSVRQSPFGDNQTITRFDGRDKPLNRELLTQVTYTAPPAAEGPPDTEDDTETGDAAGNVADDRPRDATPDAKLAALWQQRDALRQQGLAAAVMWPEWMAVQQVLINADRALHQNDMVSFGHCHDDAVDALRTIEAAVQDATTADASENLTLLQAWIQPPAAAAAVTDMADSADGNQPARPVDPRRIFENVASAAEGESSQESIAYFREPRNRREFTDWLVTKHLVDLAAAFDQLPADQRAETIQQWHAFLKNVSRVELWPVDEWPHELVGLREVLPSVQGSPQELDLLSRVLAARRDTLRLATGYGTAGTRLRAVAWNTVSPQIEQALVRTTAAARWLMVGDEGLTLAQRQLDAASRSLAQARSVAEKIHEVQSVLDALHAELPGLLELLAKRQERVVLTDTELTSATRMAEARGTAGTAVPHFPQAVLNNTDLRNIYGDMIALTQPAASAAGVDDQGARFERLQDLVDGLITAAARNNASVAEFFDALALPWLDLSQRQQLEPALRDLSFTGRSRPAGDSETGLWLAFWSIRTLSALGLPENDESELWRLWSRLVTELRRNDGAEKAAGGDEADSEIAPVGHETHVIVARVELGARLRQAWEAVLTRPPDQRMSLLTSEDDFRPLIQDDLARLAAFGDYSTRLWQLFGRRTTPQPDGLSWISETLMASPSGAVSVPVPEFANDDMLYVFSPSMTLANSKRDADDGRWRTLRLSKDNPLQLSTAGSAGLQQQANVLFVRVDSDGVAHQPQRRIISPPTDPSQWDVAFYAGDRRVLSRIGVQGKLLELIPHTLPDKPLALTVRLVRPPGDVTREADVRILALDENNQWQEIGSSRTVSFEEGAGEAAIPLLLPPETDDVAATGEAGKPQFDLSNGVRFDVTLHHPAGTRNRTVDVYPDFYAADQFVSRPEPSYDPSGLTLSIPLKPNDLLDQNALRPDKLPVHLHLSRALQNLVAVPFGGLPDLEREFIARVTFQPGIEQLLRTNSDDLQFSISAAGVPAAWRWRLTGAGNCQLLQGERPSVHPTLQLLNPDDVAAKWRGNQLLLGTDWKKAELRGEFEIHGGRYPLGRNNEYQLNVDVLRDNVPVTAYPVIRLNGQRITTTTAEPGEENSWLVSTDERLPQLDFANFKATLSEGRYRLQATLRQTSRPKELITESVAFTFDVSPPDISTSDVIPNGPHHVLDPLLVSVKVEDSQSGIERVELGFDKEALSDVPIGLADGGFQSSVQSTFAIRAEDLSQLVRPPPADQRDRAVETAELTLRATNRVGLVAEESIRVRLYREPQQQLKRDAPKPGSIEVTFDSRAVFELTLTGGPAPVTKKSAGKGQSANFPNLDAGTYDLEWKNSFSGNTGSRTGIKVNGAKVTVQAK